MLLLSVSLLACTQKPSQASVRAPEHLTAVKTTTAQVTLVWALAGGAPRPTSVEVLRDAARLATLPGSATGWIDGSVDPGTSYEYKVKAISGSTSSTSAPLDVRTKTPPLSAAALGGRWMMTETVTASTLGNTHPGQPLKPYTWKFDSACSQQKACPGKWTIVLKGPEAHGSFKWVNGKYIAGMRDQPLGFCNSSGYHASATSEIHVVKAKVVNGKWVATAVAGTYSEYYPASNGCFSSIFRAKIDGSPRN
jgi:hypothetical protein